MWLSYGWYVDVRLLSNSDLKGTLKSTCLYCRLLHIMWISIINFGGCNTFCQLHISNLVFAT